MPFYNSNNLYLPTMLIVIFGFLVVYAYSKRPALSLGVAYIKASVFFIYFYYFFDGTFTFKDDWSYLQQANKLLKNGLSVFSIFTNHTALMNMFDSRHTLYQVYNLLAFELFGKNYFSPVALNVVLTIFTSYILYKLALLLKFPKQLSLFIAITYLLHWDILVWSSFVNLKDTLVQFLELGLIYNVLKLEYKKNIIKSLLTILFLFIVFQNIRFYVPYLFVLAYIVYKNIYLFIKVTRGSKIIIIVLEVLFFTGLIVFVYHFYSYEINMIFSNFSNPLLGSIRFLLTPVPFHIETNYMFLLFPSLIHWFFFPITIYGAYIFFKKRDKKAVLWIFSYLFIFILFYGSYTILQGPRHRIQLLPILIIFQVIGFVSVFFNSKNKI